MDEKLREAIKLVEAHGLKALPREPTEKMIRLGYGGTDLVDASCTPAKDFDISDEEWEQAQLKEMRLAWLIMWDAASTGEEAQAKPERA